MIICSFEMKWVVSKSTKKSINQLKHLNMPGHGTIINTTTGQDGGSLCVDDNEGSENYKAETQDAYNATGGTVEQGDVVSVEWNSDEGRLEMTAVGTKATGDVSEDGTSITITNSGDTALSGTIAISSSNGENEGFAEARNITCGNINGEASYLS